MKKFFSILTHPILIIIVIVTLYDIGIKNNYIDSIENVKLHFNYLILIVVCLGFASGHHFLKKCEDFKLYNYHNIHKYFISKNYSDNYKKIYSEDIEEDNPSFKKFSYFDHLICYFKSEYSEHNSFYFGAIFFLVGIIYTNEELTLTYIFKNFFFVICLFLIYLKIFDWTVKIKLEEELGKQIFQIHFDKDEFDRFVFKAIFFYLSTIIIIIIYLLKYYKVL